MKQIYIGSVERSKLYNAIRKNLRLANLIAVIVVILLIVVPIAFHETIFNEANGNMSNIVMVSTSSGTGSAIYVGNNYLLTAAHVVCDMALNSTCSVEFQDPNNPDGIVIETEAELMAIGKYLPDKNPEEDYALLHLKNLNGDKIAKACGIGMSNTVKVSDKIKIIGYPAGTYSNTEGTISNITGGVSQIKELFAVDAKAWHGNSGGALLDQNGNLVGIVIAIGAIQTINDGQTYALKIDKVQSVLKAKGFQF